MSNPLEWIKKIEEGSCDDALVALYGHDERTLAHQRVRYTQALQEFVRLYGADRAVQLYSTPGRTEIGGNHTDHNNGIVMAAAVNLDILAVVAKNDTPIVRVQSQGFSVMDVVDCSDLTVHTEEKGMSGGLIRGVAAGLVERGGCVGGFDAYTTSDVLRGSGLSSSAAFEVVIGAIFNGEYNQNRFSAVEIAQVSQYAENVFFGKPSGLMDQMACSVGSAIRIDFKDPAHPVVEEAALDLEQYGFCLCVTDTKGSHANLTDDYAAIRSEMEQVAAYFGKTVLREVEPSAFYANIAQIRKQVGDRAVLRAIHFFAECSRAQMLCDAAREGDFAQFLQLVQDGGHSSFEYNQNAYSIRTPREQGVSLGLALSQQVLQGKGAWRLQGGGFAGTIQAFMPKELLPAYRDVLEAVFGAGACYALNVRNYGAVCISQLL